jgi:PiT family inorganic phosphate transporter
LIGGRRLIRTLGAKFYKIHPVDGFSSQLASFLVIISSSLMGGLVSTTQVVSSTIMGAGAADRINKVRWGMAGDILMAWLLTIPLTGLLSAGLYWLIVQFIHL